MSLDQERPDEVHFYESIDQVPQDIAKYWLQRHNIFTRYDQGIWLTDDAWFGVTPEPLARKIAEHVATAPESKTILIDAFAGAGGNVIAFALSGRWKQIFAVEQDEKTLACAKHNAEIYGVAKKIFWIKGDVFDVLQTRLKASAKNAVVFGSPPWGGPAYTDQSIFDLSFMQPYSLAHLHDSFCSASGNVVLYLPRTSDVRQISRYAKDGQKLKVIHYCMHGASKALCVFHGPFVLE